MALATRDGNLASKEDIIEEVWDGYPVGDDSITRCAAQFRRHFDGQGKEFLTTVRMRGYRLDVPVETIGQVPVTRSDVRANALNLLNRGKVWIFAALVVATVIIGIGISTRDDQRAVVVLPFENLTGNPANDYLANGFKLELLHTLSKIENLLIKDGKVPFPGLTAQQIADRLGVDFVLSGALQIVDDELKVTYTVEKGTNGKTVSAGEVLGPAAAIFALQGELAVMVRDDLVGKSAQQLISAQRDPNSAGFDRYIRGMHAFERRGRGHLDNLNSAVELFEESIELDPTFGPSYLALASAYVLLPDYRHAPLQETHDRALELVEQAVAVDPDLAAAAAAVQGYVYHKQRRWAEAEEAYLRATTATLVDSTAFNWYSLMLAGVGRVDDALGQIQLAQEIDPSSAVINSRTAIIYTWLDESERASEYYRRASQLGASGETHLLGRAMLLIREGDYEAAAELTGEGVEFAGGRTDWIKPLFRGIDDPTYRDEALRIVATAFSDSPLDPRLEIVARTMLQDIEGAMTVALSLAETHEFFEMDVLFLKELQPVREHPDFADLMDRLGVSGYWLSKGCEWLDDKVRCKEH
jgi:TolB-like protein